MKQIKSGVFIFDTFNNLLICHPTNSSFHKNWSIPKGNVDEGETVLEAAIREVFEETNVVLESDNLMYIGSLEYPNKKKELHAFITTINSNGLNLKCNSVVEKLNILENDIVKFMEYDVAFDLLHVTQQQLIFNFKNKTK